ncbi:MAG: hypothetical protein H0U75_11990 [Legionella sp.]|nr:hypothetical protein [Legionella sp.]
MKIKKIACVIPVLLSLSNYAGAGQDNSALNIDREQVIRNYIVDLERADAEGISALFEEGGTVISTSRGNVNAKEFFNGFLPEIESASTEFHQSFINTVDNNSYAARFNFKFKLKDGETGDGEYIDEFKFSNNSAKLTSVYMFENLKFKATN